MIISHVLLYDELMIQHGFVGSPKAAAVVLAQPGAAATTIQIGWIQAGSKCVAVRPQVQFHSAADTPDLFLVPGRTRKRPSVPAALRRLTGGGAGTARCAVGGGCALLGRSADPYRQLVISWRAPPRSSSMVLARLVCGAAESRGALTGAQRAQVDPPQWACAADQAAPTPLTC